MVRYLITGALSLILGISVTSYYHATQTTVQAITTACEDTQAVPPPTGTGEINTDYTPQGRRLTMPGGH